MGFDQAAFNTFVIENGAIGFFQEPLTLKSGRKTYFYINWRTVTENATLTDQLSEFILTYAADMDADCFYGVPEGATKLGIITQFKHARASGGPLAMGRAKPKPHGDPKDMFFVGKPTGTTVVIEDTTTTGGSLLAELARLKDAGVTVQAVIILTDRGEKRDDGTTVRAAIEALGIQYHALSTAPALLPAAYKTAQPGASVKKAIEAYFAQYGEAPITL
ncbi:MAG: hypothetical protein OXR66_07990 [Candidatus Woesearchaeota archaeon]|nr:hypothetical protein [Candidatus Woesearchaeota archaeon]